MNQPKRCFVIMPSADESNHNFKIYQKVIKPVVENYGYKSFWAGELDYFGDISRDIIDLLQDSDLVVADFSNNYTNVFSEQDVQKLLLRDGSIFIVHKQKRLSFDIPPNVFTIHLNKSNDIDQFKHELMKFVENFEQRQQSNLATDFTNEMTTKEEIEKDTSDKAFEPEYFDVDEIERENQELDTQKKEQAKNFQQIDTTEKIKQSHKEPVSKEKTYNKQIQTLTKEREVAVKQVTELEPQTDEIIAKNYIPRKKYDEKAQQIDSIIKNFEELRQQMSGDYVPREEYDAKLKEIESLSSIIKKYQQLPQEVATWEKNFREQFNTVVEDRDRALKQIAELEKYLKQDYIPRKDYEDKVKQIESLKTEFENLRQRQTEIVHYKEKIKTISEEKYTALEKIAEMETRTQELINKNYIPRIEYEQKLQQIESLTTELEVLRQRQTEVDHYKKKIQTISEEKDRAVEKIADIEKHTQEIISRDYVPREDHEQKLQQVESITKELEDLRQQQPEIDHYKEKIQTISEEKDRVVQKIAEIEKHNQETINRDYVLRKDYEQKLQQIESLTTELEDLRQQQTEIDHYQEKIQTISEEKDRAVEKIADIEKYNQEVINKDYVPREEYEQKLQQIESITKELEDLKQKEVDNFKEVDLSKYVSRQDYETKISEIEALKNQIDEMKQDHEGATEKKQDFEKKIQSLSRERDIALKRVAELEKKPGTFNLKGYISQKEYDAKVQEFDSLTKNFEKLRRIKREMEVRENAFKEQITTIYEERESALRKLAEVTERFNQAKQELKQKRGTQPKRLHTVRKTTPKNTSFVAALDNFVRHNKVFSYGFLVILMLAVLVLYVNRIGYRFNKPQDFQEVQKVVVDKPKSKNFRTKGKIVSSTDVKEMLMKYNFFDSFWDKKIRGYKNQFQVQTRDGDKIVIDRASNLMWQQGGSHNSMRFNDAVKWIEEMNQTGYAGYNDWRLPTLEEAMSLMEPEMIHDNLYLDLKFDNKQEIIWTSDKSQGDMRPWAVDFTKGSSFVSYEYYYNYVRAVRSVE